MKELNGSALVDFGGGRAVVSGGAFIVELDELDWALLVV